MTPRPWRTAMTVGGAATGLATATVMTGLAVRRRTGARLAHAAAPVPLGSLRSPGRTVRAADGTELYVEVDEPPGLPPNAPTLVLVHGWVLNLDAWHFQRAAFRGRCRIVLYDQRSHGRSGRAPASSCTLHQLAGDLATVLDAVVPSGPVVLVGHSMGGMTIMAYAADAPAMAERVAGVALIGTSPGRLVPLPGRRGNRLLAKASPPLQSALTTVAPALEASRRATGGFAYELTRRMGFGGRVPDEQVAFVDAMIAANPMTVFTDYYPLFTTLDLDEMLSALAGTPVFVIAGSRDAVTPLRHSRRIAELVPSAELVVLERAGHLLMLERPDEVNRLLSRLLGVEAGAG